MSAEGRKQLLEFLETDPILAFDYDGTLCPIVSCPEDAVIDPVSRQILNELCIQRFCVVLTGRSRADILPKLENLAFAQVVGSHGADWAASHAPGLSGVIQERWSKRVSGWKRKLEQRLRALEGIEIEDKALSLSVHYRLAREHREAVQRIRASFEGLRGLRVIGGKEVFNLLPRECAGKGQALRELKRAFGKRSALFVGDDLTDEEVFELPERDRVFKIRVGYGLESKASHYLEAQTEIRELLEILLHRGRTS